MELRVLQYFLAVAREQSISRAAQSLHLSQPTLSTQIKALEEELGKKLLDRGVSGSRKVTLTDEGIILRKRAEEILSLVKRTEDEIALSDQIVAGDVYIGAGETDGVRLLTRAAQRTQERYPDVHFHISSGDGADVTDDLDKGLIDFGLLLQTVDISKYEYLELPVRETWGVLVRRDSPLAERAAVTPEDIVNQPLIVSRQAFSGALLHAQRGGDLQPALQRLAHGGGGHGLRAVPGRDYKYHGREHAVLPAAGARAGCQRLSRLAKVPFAFQGRREVHGGFADYAQAIACEIMVCLPENKWRYVLV